MRLTLALVGGCHVCYISRICNYLKRPAGPAVNLNWNDFAKSAFTRKHIPDANCGGYRFARKRVQKERET